MIPNVWSIAYLILQLWSIIGHFYRRNNLRWFASRSVVCRCLFESHAICSNHKVARTGCGTTRRGTAPRSVQCCVPRVRGTRHAHAVSNKWRDRRVWSHLRGCRSFSLVPAMFQPRSSCSPRLPSPLVSPGMSIRVVPACLDTGMDLTGIFSPPDIRLATKIGETQREVNVVARDRGERVGRAEIRLRGSRARPPWSFYYRGPSALRGWLWRCFIEYVDCPPRALRGFSLISRWGFCENWYSSIGESRSKDVNCWLTYWNINLLEDLYACGQCIYIVI